MYRFRIHSKDESSFVLSGKELHHLTHVLRLSTGEKVTGFDNSGRQWTAIIETLTGDSAECKIIAEEYPEVEAKTKVYLVMGLAKGEKMDWVIQKGTEIGMAGFIPLRTQRSVLKLEGKKAEERVLRWQKIAGEAVKQSGRVIEPIIEQVTDWKDLKKVLPAGTQVIIAYENEDTSSLNDTLKSVDPKYPIALIIGPEGGFAAEEIQNAFKDQNARCVSLGVRILRTETAAVASLVMVLAYFGDMGQL